MKQALLVLALVAVLAVGSAVPAYAHDGSGDYTVVQGDLSLWTIAIKLGISFGALLDANWDNPGLSECLMLGDRVELP